MGCKRKEMPTSAIYILDSKGKPLIYRNYRYDIPSNIPARFTKKIMEEEDEMNLKPIFEEDGISFAYIRHRGLYLLAVSNMNSNAMLMLTFLYKLLEVFKSYFKRLEEESIRDNFVIIYELLDEMMDYGYAQSTESTVLKEFIKTEHHALDKMQVRPPPALTKKVSWRPEGIVYRKNEVFLDVVEKVHLLVNRSGNLLRSEIEGAVQLRCFLTGMPELRMGLNDRLRSQTGRGVEMEDVNFHQCVRLSRWESERTVEFTPPDGEFTLMTYRVKTNIRPLIQVQAVIDAHKGSRIEYMIKARAQFKNRSVANNVIILVPVPEDADTPKFKTSIGRVRYAPEKNAIVWLIKTFQGGKEYYLRAHFGLPSLGGREGDPTPKTPISVHFEIPYYTVSGLQVRYLKIVERSGYQALPWVRYITKSGDYQIRT